MDERPAPDQQSSSPLADSGAGAESAFSDERAADPVKPCQKKTWVAIELKDNKGRPVAGEAYQIELPDGRTVEGVLDGMGAAGVDLIDPGNCKITFPNLHAKSWRKA